MRLSTGGRRIGATDAAPLLGVGKWANARDIYERIVNGVHAPENAAMRRGTRAEPAVRARYAAESGATMMVLPGKVFAHDVHEWATCSPDDISLDLDGRPSRLVEYKTASRWVGWGEEPPADYVLQCQWGLWVLGLDLAVLYVSFGEDVGDEWRTTGIGQWLFHADAELQATFLEVGGAFWRSHVLTKTPPPMAPKAKHKRNTNQGDQQP